MKVLFEVEAGVRSLITGEAMRVEEAVRQGIVQPRTPLMPACPCAVAGVHEIVVSFAVQ